MLQIRTAAPIAVEVDDVRVMFVGDPTEDALLALIEAQDRFVGAPIAEQIRAIGTLRGSLRTLVLEESVPAWDELMAAGKLTIGVVMSLFQGVVGSYGESLGFRGGSSSTYVDGRPENVDTSAA